MNRIIVESKNDKAFFTALISHLDIKNTEVDSPILINEEDFVLTEGIDANPLTPTSLITKLKDIKSEIRKDTYIQNVGIVLDLDNSTISDRLLMVNTAIKNAFAGEYSEYSEITGTCTFFTMNYDLGPIHFACYFTNVNERGELETLLKNIASRNSDHADCLNSWRHCIENKGHSITQKEFDKFWISNYLRFDTCSRRDRSQAHKYCSMASFENVMAKKPDIFNLDSPLLDEMKHFLRLFA